jgi:predicted DNA-binding transcriptional regulator AlpA
MTTADTRNHAEVWTAQRIHALGPITDIPTAAAILGISRSLGYQLAHHDRFPVPIIRAGQRYIVPVAALLAALHIPQPDSTRSDVRATPTDEQPAART